VHVVQFHDGVYLVLLMGLLEGYFVPLHHFHLTPSTNDQKVDLSPQLNSLDSMHACLIGSGSDLILRLILFMLLLLFRQPLQKQPKALSNWIRMTFGRIVLQVNLHQLIKSDFELVS